MERRSGYLGPLLIISTGFILLFSKLGFLHWGAWASLMHYWPVILILWGIEILARNTESALLYFVAVFLSIVLIIASIFMAWTGYPPPDETGNNLMRIIFDNMNIDGEKAWI